MDRKEKFSVTLTYENGHPVLNQVAIILSVCPIYITALFRSAVFGKFSRVSQPLTYKNIAVHRDP
jgi:hypothetical protein